MAYDNQKGMRLASRRLPYLPGLDGLRAIAVIAVLVYHAEARWLPGGFLGVEVFFVISGYLVTALLLADHERSGKVDLGGFWLRRARRLLPAVLTLIGAVVAYALIFLPAEAASLRDDSLAALIYLLNWHLIFAQQSYFEEIGRPSLLGHLWSLAVEEQLAPVTGRGAALGAARLGLAADPAGGDWFKPADGGAVPANCRPLADLLWH